MRKFYTQQRRKKYKKKNMWTHKKKLMNMKI